MRVITVPFMLLAAVGFLLSLYAHLMAMFDLPIIWGESVMFLHVGIFVVWLPTVLISQRLVKHASQKDFWKVALRGCPPWMRAALYGIFGYGVLSFIYFLLVAKKGSGDFASDATAVRGFSGHWLIFYGAAFTTLYSASNRPDLLEGVKCPKGHDVDPLAKFCSACGAAIRARREVL